ncbi:hypothetical protein AMTR_s01849p00005400, partial [Amborella trichopoda]
SLEMPPRRSVRVGRGRGRGQAKAKAEMMEGSMNHLKHHRDGKSALPHWKESFIGRMKNFVS